MTGESGSRKDAPRRRISGGVGRLFGSGGGLRRPTFVSLVIHALLFTAVTVFARPRFTPPKPLEEFPVDFVALPAPQEALTHRVEETPAIPPEVVPDPTKKPRPKPPPKKEEPPKPKPKKEENKVKPKRDLPKQGAKEKQPARKTELPAVGDAAQVSLRAEGPITQYGYYLNLIQRKIASFWEAPTGLAQAGNETTATVWFRIERDGKVSNSYVEEPSGWGIFDTSALRALGLAAPLPPLPADFPDQYLIIHLRFVYQE